MKFYIESDNGSGMKYASKEDFLKELSLQIDDCIENGGTYFAVHVDADAERFMTEDDDVKNATFTSVWNDGFKATTDCKVDMKTGEVSDVKHTYQADGSAPVNQYITIDGKDYPVFDGSEFWIG